MSKKEEKPKPPAEGEAFVLQVSDPAHGWAINSLSKTEHGWHEPLGSCQTCFNRYATLTTAFDAGYQHGVDEALSLAEVGGPRLLTTGGGIIVPKA